MTSALTATKNTFIFGGQASNWVHELSQYNADGTNQYLHNIFSAARIKLSPLAGEIATAVPGALARLDDLLTTAHPTQSPVDVSAMVSMPGILLAQIGALKQLHDAGVPVAHTPGIGHSQGILALEAAQHIEDPEQLADIVALSLIMGATSSLRVRELGGSYLASRMLSVRGLCSQAINEALGSLAQTDQGKADIALRNGRQDFVLAGQPDQLALAKAALSKGAQLHNKEIEAKRKGGSIIEPVWDELPVAVPFHHECLRPALDQTIQWARLVGLDREMTVSLAENILVTPQDWPAQVAQAVKNTQTLVILGPGSGLVRMTTQLVEGSGVGVLDASDVAKRDQLSAPGSTVPPALDYSAFAPQLVRLSDGQLAVETAFTRLTGHSPILLAGMTPTTVDPEIVAAAANAGFWAEMAGGGQYSLEVFTANKNGLIEDLEPGRTAQFNTMFFDRFMWNLQFGTQKIVSKARAAGAPISGVTISAGIPEVDEATELIATLHADGFPYICFKPGTVQQIKAVLAIADANTHANLIMQVEDGHAGGHHSWVNLDDLLIETYADIRRRSNIVLCVGGGIGTPQIAADYITGQWSHKHGLPAMPVDGILVGTAAMTTKEAKTSPQVKQLLKDTPGVALSDDGGWVGRSQSRGGVASGLSHLHADMYEIDNSSAACSRLLAEVGSDMTAITQRRSEIISALNKTSKPFFGEISHMTYQEWAQRFVDLSYPWTDPTWPDRFLDLIHRIEARLHPTDHGSVPTLFADIESVSDAHQALAKLSEAYPQATTTLVNERDAAWFISLCRKHHKPMPFVPVIDADVARWWGLDTLWQSHDERYDADSVRIIPGPVSVAGIDRVDEPVADLLTRFETACCQRLASLGLNPIERFARLDAARTIEEYLRKVPHIVWNGHLIDNPAHILEPDACHIRHTDGQWELAIIADTYWDNLPQPHPYAVDEVTIPLDIPASAATGAVPLVSRERLPQAVYRLLAGVAGIGSTSVGGDELTALPGVVDDPQTPFGVVHDHVTLTTNVWETHMSATGAGVVATADGHELRIPHALADALVGPCWPAIYAALGSAHLADGYPLIEGLLNAVHLDHCIDLDVDLQQITNRVLHVDVTAQTAVLEESASGRIVTVNLEISHHGQRLARLIERFAIRGRVTTAQAPSHVGGFGGQGRQITPTPRSFIRQVSAIAPRNMTAFAIASGDYNPIHTSQHAAQLVGLQDALVHGMWLSAVAQTVACAGEGSRAQRVLLGWTYSMYGMVQLNDEVDILVERIGRGDGACDAIEVTCRIGETIVSRGQAIVAPARTAYVYPGQGIQHVGMGTIDRQQSTVVRQVWERADRHTRSQHGFSIIHIVDSNPTEIKIGNQTLRHPEGVLNLTQFTQVALAVLAYGQSKRLHDENALVPNSLYAGHSLGEYTALAACAGIFDLEAVIDVVYSRGSAMHSLVERDDTGRSNYRLGALRPNQLGIDADNVVAYVENIAETTGEFLQIVNYNLAGQQYAIAGTVAGLAALAHDAEERALRHGGKRPFMLIPGIDVPFHSHVLRAGVPDFARKLDELLPPELDHTMLVGRYIPNLVARPFELSREFAQTICDEVPSRILNDLLADGQRFETLVHDSPGKAARILVIELLSWQFASPVRWIETQALLFTSRTAGGLGVEHLVEVGLAQAPTLANLAEKTLQLPELANEHVIVSNLERDHATLYATDAIPIPAPDNGAVNNDDEETTNATSSEPDQSPSSSQQDTVSQPQPISSNAGLAESGSTSAPDIAFDAGHALMVLFAIQGKVTTEQITPHDTTDSLTNGVSSRRNQLLMDMSTELGVSTIDGAAESDVATLQQRVVGAAPGYTPYGPVLGDVVRTRLRTIFGGAGMKITDVADRVTTTWSLPASWVAWVDVALVLGTREGESVRGGNLNTLGVTAVTTKAQAHELIDAAIHEVASQHSVTVSLTGGTAAGNGGVIDSAALEAYADQVTGPDGILATVARTVLSQLGLANTPEYNASHTDAELNAILEAELGSTWLTSVSPSFDARQAVLFDDRWASAREDLAHAGARGVCVEPSRFTATGDVVAGQARWWAHQLADKPEVAHSFLAAAKEAQSRQGGKYSGEIALVTGGAPGSIATSVVGQLLAGGATVIMTASRVTPERVDFARELYAKHARGEAALWLVPANLSSYRDVDSLVDWIASTQVETAGEVTTVVKPAMVPTLVFPFAAGRVFGTLADAGANAESQARLLLWSVERIIARLAEVAINSAPGSRVHVVLPGSPNRGIFGGDGAYGEVKAAFDAICHKWFAESDWTRGITLAHPRIGWVSGTHLMGGNDGLVPAAQAHGIHVFTPDEISQHLLELCTHEAKERAKHAPLEADFTGGLGQNEISLPELARQVASDHDSSADGQSEDLLPQAVTIPALPTDADYQLPEEISVGEVTTALEDMIVIVGTGEVSAWGSGRTRSQAEYGLQRDGSVDLTAAGVLELAWMMNLVHWSEDPHPGWYDRQGALVAESDIYDRYRDEVVARCGIRTLVDSSRLVDQGSMDVASVYLDRDIEFSVSSEAEARDYVAADPQLTSIVQADDDEWIVRKRAGSVARVPKKATLSRTVAGQLPTDFDPARWGIPTSMLDGMDRIAAWNLVTAVDAFLSAGFTPAELLQAVHPTEVASTQGTGIGGMESLRQVFLDRFLGADRPQDILQEALPNVVAAHVMQAYVGGYGAMIHPVAACATAAVSVEEAVDKIKVGKASFVVAGGIDDIGVESLTGFGDMNATAESAVMAGKGIAERFYSRANDRRRGGFVEAAGGGTVLLARGDVAAAMGLPVLAVVAHAQSYADGSHTSIPAPGIGALSAARGGRSSAIARSLAGLGLTPDDVRVVSKHDTSTNANDPNETELHQRMWQAVGRSAGNPLFVISQKSLTGHAKGGAAVFQIAGLTEVLRSGRIPANVALDCVAPDIGQKGGDFVWLRNPMDMGAGEVKAGVLSSLGFGHVSAVIVLAHPQCFVSALANAHGDVAQWRARANERLQAGAKRMRAGMIGQAPLFEPTVGRRLPHVGAHEAEVAMLLDPQVRLSESGVFPEYNGTEHDGR